MRDERNELEVERPTLLHTKEQQDEAVRSQRAVLIEEMERVRVALADQQQQQADSARARDVQLQLRVEEGTGGGKGKGKAGQDGGEKGAGQCSFQGLCWRRGRGGE